MLKYLLSPHLPSSITVSLITLWTRIIIGMLFLNHGIEKWMNFNIMVETFPDPLWLGSTISLILVIFAEVFCAFAFIFGIFFRIALIPMIINMSVAFFVVHSDMPLSIKELSLLYLIIFVACFIAGPGRYSVDHIFLRKCCNTGEKYTEIDLDI